MLNKSPSTKNFYNYGALSDNYFHIRERVLLDDKLNQKIKEIKVKDSLTKVGQVNGSLKYAKSNLQRNMFGQSQRSSGSAKKFNQLYKLPNSLQMKSPQKLQIKSPNSSNCINSSFKNYETLNSPKNHNSIIADFRRLKNKSFADHASIESFKKKLPPLKIPLSPSSSNFFITSALKEDLGEDNKKSMLENISLKKYMKAQSVSQSVSLQKSINELSANLNNNKMYNYRNNRNKKNMNNDPFYNNIINNKIHSSFHKLNMSQKMNLSTGSFRSSSSQSISREKAREIKKDNQKFKHKLERVNSPLNKEKLFKSSSAQAKIGERIKRVKPLSDVFRKISSVKFQMNGMNFNNLKFDKHI